MNRPWGFFWCNIAALVASLLTGLRILPGPEPLGIILAFHALFVLPGMIVWRMVPGGVDLTVGGVVRVFLTGLAVSCSVICIGFIPHMSYPLISLVYSSVMVIGLIVILLRKPRGRERAVSFPGMQRTVRGERRLMLAVFSLLFAICFVLLYGSAETGVSTDAPDHLSFIRRSLDGGALLPHDSFYRGGDGAGFDQRKGLWHPVSALWAWQADAPPEELWRAMPALLGFFAIMAFWGFAGELVGGVPMKLLALVLLLLVFRGEGADWLSKLGYSRNIAQVTAWGTFMAVIKYLRGSRRIDLAAAALWSAAGTAIHAVFAIITGTMLLSLAVYTAFSAEGRFWKRRFAAVAGVVAAAVTGPAVLRLLYAPGEANLIHTHMQGILELGSGFRMIDPVELVLRFDPTILFACAVTPFVFFLGRDRVRERLVGTLFAVPALMALSPPAATVLERSLGYFHIRILHAAPAVCLLAIAVAGLGSVVLRGPRHRQGADTGAIARAAARIAAVGALVLLLAALRPATDRLGGDLRRFITRSTPGEPGGYRIAAALDGLPPHSVIASDPATSYLVSAFTDHFVVVTLDQHGPPSDLTALDRMARTRDLFDPDLPLETSAGWLSSEGVDYIVFDADGFAAGDFFGVTAFLDPASALEKLRSRPDYLAETKRGDGVSLFAVHPRTAPRPDTAMAARVPHRCSTTPSEVAPMSIPGPFALARFEAGPDSLSAGDTITVRFCWILEDPVRFGLPFYWTLRFDTPFPRGAMYREWYGKHYRRIVERRNGEFYRYTSAERIASGTALPDTWPAGVPVMQTASFALPRALAPGVYEVRLSVERRAYLPNRTPDDYLLNEDSLWGVPVATLTVASPRPPRKD